MPDDSDHKIEKRYKITIQAERKRDVELASIRIDIFMAKQMMEASLMMMRLAPGVRIITKP